MIVDISNADVCIGSAIYQPGITEDGNGYISEVYYISVTLPSGVRYNHNARFYGAKPHYDNESGCYYFEDLRGECMDKCNILLDKITNAGVIDTQYWVETSPAYGSNEYVQSGIEAQRAFEERYGYH